MLSQKRVLVVDDDRAIRRMVTTVLTREGYDVDEAGGGEEALKEIAWDGYHVIILDLTMPVVSGYDVLRAIFQARPNSRCVVIMSAAGQREIDNIDPSMIRTKLRKPFNLDELVTAVRSCVEVILPSRLAPETRSRSSAASGKSPKRSAHANLMGESK